MQANIINGVHIRVGGDAGRTKGLKLRILENMFGHLQDLISLLAKYELETDESPNLKEFEIELYDFKPGSAVPAFRLAPKPISLFPEIVNKQKIVVAEKFDELMSYANKGIYENFFPQEQLPEVRQDIAEELYGFIISAGNSPITIVEPIAGNGQFKEIYKVPKFTKQQSDNLLKPRIRRTQGAETEQIFALVQRVGKRRTILDLYENKNTILSVAPISIIVENKIYHLHTPLLCTVHKEDGNFIIENEMLDLYAAGENIDIAEHDLYKEFDESYQLLNSLRDDQLSERLLRAKDMMNSYIKEITND